MKKEVGEKKKVAIGVDVGGTNTAIGVVDVDGNVMFKDNIPTSTHGDFEKFVEELSTAIQSLINSAKLLNENLEVLGVGIGAPNGNYYNGTIEYAPNLSFRGVLHFIRMLRPHFPEMPALALTNDANAAAIGEMTYGAARGMKDFIVITLGTGVGSGIVVNGQMVYGHDGFAGELGHVIMRRTNGRVCGCGRSGCLEAYTSATGVARTAREYLELQHDAKTQLRNIPIDDITSKDVFDAAMAGDEMAKEIFRFTGEMLGEAFADFVAFSSPEAIILFGGLAKAGDLIMNPIRESMERNLLPIFKNKVKLIFSELKESDAAVLGASALGWEVR